MGLVRMVTCTRFLANTHRPHAPCFYAKRAAVMEKKDPYAEKDPYSDKKNAQIPDKDPNADKPVWGPGYDPYVVLVPLFFCFTTRADQTSHQLV